MQKQTENFFKKKSWSQMIQNCLIRREKAKKIRRQMAVFDGIAAVSLVFQVGLINSNNF